MHEEKRCPSSRGSIHFLSFLSRAFRRQNKSSFKSSFGKKGTGKNCCSRPALSDFARVLRSSRVLIKGLLLSLISQQNASLF